MIFLEKYWKKNIVHYQIATFTFHETNSPQEQKEIEILHPLT